MSFANLANLFGDGFVVSIGGLLIGLVFGALAQRSRFCMRSAVIDIFRYRTGPKLAIWGVAFAAAIIGTQGLIMLGMLDVSAARQLVGQGSLSGAIIGGLMFGTGMVLARGCASRILVLSATGNLRALVTGLILTIVAQSSLRGILSPLREWLASLWVVVGEAERDLSMVLDFSTYTPLLIGMVIFASSIIMANHHKVSRLILLGSSGVGVMVAIGWLATYLISLQSFEPVGIKSISFIGPSADTLMGLIDHRSLPLTFDLGLVPGVFIGSLLAALMAREFKFQCFSIEEFPMPRYIIGAVLMGFGGMLAGGCAVGAVMTGGSVFSLTAWVAFISMWAGGGIADLLIDRQNRPKAIGELSAVKI